MIDLTDSATTAEVPPEDYPVLVFLRDQLAQAREEAEGLRQELAARDAAPGTTPAPDAAEAELAKLRDHYERLLDDEQSRRSELQASLESERLLRMEAETKIEAAREELTRVRVELRAALRNERARAVEARKAVANLEDEVAGLKSRATAAPTKSSGGDSSAERGNPAANKRSKNSTN